MGGSVIVGTDWIWLHFPKCGGTSAESMLRLNFGNDPSVRFDDIDPSNVIWHDTIATRTMRDPSFSSESRRIVAIFRRLPAWILSRVHYEASRAPYHIVTRDQLIAGRFYKNSGEISTAEETLNRFNSPRVTKWIRLEKMHEDFEAFFGRPLQALDQHLNVNEFDYIRDIGFWFSKQELENLYHKAPNWAAIEKEIYGSLPV